MRYNTHCTTPEDSEAMKDNKKKFSILWMVLADVLLTGLSLIVFALFHHVLPQAQTGEVILLPTLAPTPAVTASPAPTLLATPTAQATATGPAPSPTPEPGMWGEKFAGHFASGDVIVTDNSYQSRDIHITVDRVQEDGVTYYVADIYLRNLDALRTAFAGGEYGKGNDRAHKIAEQYGAILAISGDYYGSRRDGVVIRNGVLYRDDPFADVLILYNDGTMQTYTEKEFDMGPILESGAWQGWSFGPMLLTDGQPMTRFNSNLTPANPRAAIGYYEPGHYCFVLVDGRQPGYSTGMTLKQLSQLFYDLGCTVAYNLDGGQSAEMTFMGELINQPYKGGREVSDIIYIVEREVEP